MYTMYMHACVSIVCIRIVFTILCTIYGMAVKVWQNSYDACIDTCYKKCYRLLIVHCTLYMYNNYCTCIMPAFVDVFLTESYLGP